jgi:hypothetical protein
MALAGPWLREEGSGFLSTSALIGADGTAASVYVEYGWRPKTTLVGKIDHSASGTQTALVALRKPIGPTDKTWRLAYDLGAGVERRDDLTYGFARTGLSVGRGLSFGEDRSGWAVIDLSFDQPFSGLDPTLKIDATLGIGLNDTWKVMAQVFFSATPTDQAVTFAPSGIYSPRKNVITYQVGLELNEAGPHLRLALWRDF